QVGPVGGVLAGDEVGLSAHRPVRDALVLAEQHRVRRRLVTGGRPGDQAGAGAGDHVPAVARPADLPPVDGGAPALVDHDEPGLRPAGELAFAVAADGLVPHHHRAGQDGRGEQREAHGPTTPPSARTLVPITSASPTTTPVNAVGAKNSSATSATCSTV